MNHPDALGTAVWADMADIADRYAYNPETDFFLGRNPYNFDQPIGHNDDTHVFMCAGIRSGKGRAVVINNLLNWRGSVVSVDPKGENASICAERRAGGNDYCRGLGQKTYVLDPYGLAQVPDHLRASCNLLDMLDANSPSLLSECETLAEAMRMTQEGGESESWSKDGAQITALVIAHVKTAEGLDGMRDLVTVRDFLIQGHQGFVDRIVGLNKAEIKAAKIEDREPKLKEVPDPYEVLFQDMVSNNALRGTIARRARARLDLMRTNARQHGSLIENARSETGFIDDLCMEDQLISRRDNHHSLNINDLKADKKGISVFVCLPDKPSHPAVRWQKAILTLILDRMATDQRRPATGKQVLMVLDEFGSMGKMPMIQDGMNSLAGAGVKFFIIVTNLSTLQRLYGETTWKEFVSGAGTQIWFGIRDKDTAKYIEEDFGEAHLVLNARNASLSTSRGTSTNKSKTTAEGTSESMAEGRSLGESETLSSAQTSGNNFSITESNADTWQHSEGTGKSRTDSRGSTWNVSDAFTRGGHRSSSFGRQSSTSRNGLFDPFVRSVNDGSNSSSSSGTSNSTTRNTGRSGSYNRSNTISQNTNDSVGGSHGTAVQQGRHQSKTDTHHGALPRCQST